MRIHITGNAGSGKTSLAKELGEILNVNVFGLDRIVWKANWVVTPKEERFLLEQELIDQQEWIIEGVSSAVRKAADCIIFIDLPRGVCIKRAGLRSFKYLFSTRPELPSNCPEIKIIHKLIKIIWQFDQYAKPNIINDMTSGNSITISTQSELDDFLAVVKQKKAITFVI